VGEHYEEHDPADLTEARKVIGQIIELYNHERLHAALDYLPPATENGQSTTQTGEPEPAPKTAEPRHRRKRLLSYTRDCPILTETNQG
jgi:hypothetical protein